MKLFLISFFMIALAIFGMALGVMLGGRKRCLRGSCGGLNQANGEEGQCLCSANSHEDHS